MIYFNKKKEYKGVKEETTIKIDLLKVIKIILEFFYFFIFYLVNRKIMLTFAVSKLSKTNKN